MAGSISPTGKILMLDALGHATTGAIRIIIYDDSATQVGATQTIAWAAASGFGTMSMSSADIVFSVPAGTIVSGMTLYFWTGSELGDPAGLFSFEQQYTYTNAGTFTITDVTISAV